jgi:hypothetical protein
VSRAVATLAGLFLISACAACAGPPAVPEQPSWADVQPIMRASCTGCHGGSAPEAGSALGVTYRLDFFDMTPESCGDAAIADASTRFARAAATQIACDITSDDASIRPRMPPEPAPWLPDWQWRTLLRWTRDPIKGDVPAGNHPPAIALTSPKTGLERVFTLAVKLDDPDGDSVVGTLTIEDVTIRLDRPGAFAIAIDATQWGPGPFHPQAVICDGWTRVAVPLDEISFAR